MGWTSQLKVINYNRALTAGLLFQNIHLMPICSGIVQLANIWKGVCMQAILKGSELVLLEGQVLLFCFLSCSTFIIIIVFRNFSTLQYGLDGFPDMPLSHITRFRVISDVSYVGVDEDFFVAGFPSWRQPHLLLMLFRSLYDKMIFLLFVFSQWLYAVIMNYCVL